jgi:peroxiredoxin
LTIAQGPDRADWQLTPRLETGLELVYVGTYAEESLIRNVQYQRQYRIDASLLVLDAGLKDFHGAFMTTLSLKDGKQPFDKKDGPSSVRIELARIDLQGRARSNDKKFLDIPVAGPPSLECGFLVPAPPVKVGRNANWQVGETGQPAQRWQVEGTEACSGLTCIKLTAVRQSEDWNTPRADQSAWRRRDTVWLHPQLFVAQKVERIIERRDPARDAPTFRTVVRYELDSRLKYPGILFNERKNEALKAAKFHEDAQPLLRQPGSQRAQIDSMIQRVAYHLDHQSSSQVTPYRKAVVQVKTLLEKAQRGEPVVPHESDDPPPLPAKALGVGERVTDFAVSSLTEDKTAQFKHYQGKPILVFFYNPATPLGKEVVTYAKRLHEKQSGKFGVMALAVTGDADMARAQHKSMQLPFPLLDGNGLRLMFGADQTPRFVVVDQDGLVRFAETGWGLHTAAEIEEVLQKCPKK